MILNPVFIQNLRPKEKRKVCNLIVSMYHHFGSDDQEFIRKNIHLLLDVGETVIVPLIDGRTTRPIRHFAECLEAKDVCVVKYVDYTSYNLISRNHIIIGEDVFQIASNWEKYRPGQLGRLMELVEYLSRRSFEFGIDAVMKYIIAYLTDYIRPHASEENLKLYCKVLTSVTKSCDIILSIRASSILQISYGKLVPICLADWAILIESLVDHLCKRQHDSDQAPIDSIIKDLIAVEFLFFHTIVPESEVLNFTRSYSICKKLIKLLGYDDSELVRVDVELERLMENMQKSQFFTDQNFGMGISNAARNTTIWTYDPNVIDNSQTMETDALLERLTKEKICDIISEKTSAILEPDDISFDIFSDLIAMWQKEFGQTYHIKLHMTKDKETRFLIEYQGKTMVGFMIPKNRGKIYGATVLSDPKMDTDIWTFVEFAGAENLQYKAVF